MPVQTRIISHTIFTNHFVSQILTNDIPFLNSQHLVGKIVSQDPQCGVQSRAHYQTTGQS